MNAQDRKKLLQVLQARFEKHVARHKGVSWVDVQARLESAPKALAVLQKMEASGGEPDVIARDAKSGRVTFCDCSAESPAGRRSLCYDAAALASRKENKPAGSAAAMAAEIGVELLTEDDYRALQQLGEFDLKTSSWVATPEDVRSRGGALFCDRQIGRANA